MEQLRYIGTHQPKGMIIDVEDSEVKRLLDSGNYERITEVKEVKEEKPNEKWTEMQIYDWIMSHNITIKYKPVSDTKSSVLKKLKEGGYI